MKEDRYCLQFYGEYMDKNTRTRMYCLSAARRLLSRFAAAAAMSACMLSAGVNSYAIDFNQSKVVNLGAGFTVPIIDNNGQLSGAIDFVAPGPTGNTVYFYNNGEIGLALRGYSDIGMALQNIRQVAIC